MFFNREIFHTFFPDKGFEALQLKKSALRIILFGLSILRVLGILPGCYIYCMGYS